MPKIPEITISGETKTFQYWKTQPYITDKAVKDAVDRANVLIVPREKMHNADGPIFSSDVPSVLEYLESTAPKELRIAVAVDEDKYREAVLHGLLLILGTFVVTAIAAPIVAQLIANYIQKRIDNSKGNNTVRFSITVVAPDGSGKRLEYDGPAEQFRDLVIPRLNDVAGKMDEAGKHSEKLKSAL